LLSDPVAERAAIAGACKSRDNYLELSYVLSPDSFQADRANAALWKCVSHIYEDERPPERVDVATLMGAANHLGLGFLFSDKGETDHVRAVLEMDLDELSPLKMGGKVGRLHIARQAVGKVKEVQKRLESLTGNESVDALLSCLEGPLLDFSASIQGQGSRIQLLGQEAERYVEHKLANPVQQMGIPSGFKLYDEFIGGGLRPNSVNVVAARLKTGKSMFTANVAVNVAYKGYPVLLLDTEMSDEEQMDRILARIAEIPSRKIEMGCPGHTAEERRRLVEAARKLRDMPLHYLVVRGLQFEEVLAQARRWLHRVVGFQGGKAKPCVVVFDYLKLMDDKPISKQVSEFQALGFMTTALKNFVGRYHVAT
jgi:replicative DNA helicase